MRTTQISLSLLVPTRILFEGKAAYEEKVGQRWREGRVPGERCEGFLASSPPNLLLFDGKAVLFGGKAAL
jgi:hypothetical protein